ncbi:PrsW family intramembrane metalloprotease [Leptospira sp. GIMC2001]|uniref:PrsW family intramembrane metalloprotease n=1 Tax=Leptospira sp. GIMC2001 TaxID=1513297 RepID=UPI00234A220B|nr:PrsW family glutamic-type intramembrane protease [Leptospira sp. GIMC2001]WCL47794.1 PrsW family glutamic-type intramembrane protease [Leptospira sp. GIMC2001]
MLSNPFVLLALAVLPGLIYVTIYYGMDKHRKEPVGIVLKTFFWGAALVFPIGLLQTYIPEEMFAGFAPLYALYMICIVGFTEELGKWLVTRYYSYNNTHFDELTDGLVYGACAGGGFAVFENIFYVFDHGFETGIIRAGLSVPGHIFWGAISGYWLAKHKFDGASQATMFIRGLGFVSVAHGLFNTFLSYGMTMIFAPVIVVYCGILTHKYFKSALKHDFENIHSLEMDVVTSEQLIQSEDGSVSYKKEVRIAKTANPILLNLLSNLFKLMSFVFFVTTTLLALHYADSWNEFIDNTSLALENLASILVLVTITYFLFHYGRSFDRKATEIDPTRLIRKKTKFRYISFIALAILSVTLSLIYIFTISLEDSTNSLSMDVFLLGYLLLFTGYFVLKVKESKPNQQVDQEII